MGGCHGFDGLLSLPFVLEALWLVDVAEVPLYATFAFPVAHSSGAVAGDAFYFVVKVIAADRESVRRVVLITLATGDVRHANSASLVVVW